jgi:hypothetical protein
MPARNRTVVKMPSLAILVACAVWIQTVFPLPLPARSQSPAGLNIVVVEGHRAINNIRQRTAHEPVVRVWNEERKPVAGAVVAFFLPEGGPGGAFPGGARTLTVTTGADGQAVARGLQPNNIAGDFEIQVTATYQGASASAVISQSNVLDSPATTAPAGGGSGKLFAILAIVGGAAAAGAIAATRGGTSSTGSSSSSTPTTISPGTPSVGAPR